MTKPTLARRSLIQTIAPLALALGACVAVRGEMLDDVLYRLNADDLQTRDSATSELRALISDTSDPAKAEFSRHFEQVSAEALRTRDLTLEQRVRLMDVLRDRFFQTPRGAMGVQFVQPQVRPQGVELGQVIGGFPAAEQGLLRAGDVITAVDGVSLIGQEMAQLNPVGMNRASERLRHVVISHDPDELIELTLVRPLNLNAPQNPQQPPEFAVRGGGDLITEGPGKNAAVITVQVPLGSFERLRSGGNLDPNTLEGAWRQRAERLGIPEIEIPTLGTPLTLRQWMTHARAADQSPPMLLAARGGAGANERQPHAALVSSGNAQQLDLRQVPAPIEVRMQRMARQAQLRANNIEIKKEAPAAPAEDIMSMLQTVGALNRQRDTLLQQAADPTTTEKRRREAAAEAAQLQEFINRMDTVIQRKIVENAKAQEDDKK